MPARRRLTTGPLWALIGGGAAALVVLIVVVVVAVQAGSHPYRTQCEQALQSEGYVKGETDWDNMVSECEEGCKALGCQQ